MENASKSNNLRSLRSSLVLSVLSLVVCAAMFTATTFAWFSVTLELSSEKNKIVIGYISSRISYLDETGSWQTLEADSNPFIGQLSNSAEPLTATLKIENTGNSSMKFDTAVSVVGEIPGIDSEGNAFRLSEALNVKASISDTENQISAFSVTDDTLSAPTEMILDPGEDKYLTLTVAPIPGVNINTGKGEAASISLGLSISAVQVTTVADSFGFDYADDATAPEAGWNGEVSDISDIPTDEFGAYLVSTADQLAGIAAAINSGNISSDVNIELQNDINLSNNPWTPINVFSGAINGNGHKIYNLIVDGPGFIGELGGSVSDLSIVGGSVSNSDGVVGGIAAVAGENARLSGCVASLKLTGKTVGGLVGQSTAGLAISQCVSYCDINSANAAGGIVGLISGNSDVDIQSSENFGNISGSSDYVGGIVGLVDCASSTVSVSSCKNFGEISSTALNGVAGGILGSTAAFATQISNCENSGNINSLSKAGGIVGNGTTTGIYPDGCVSVNNCINSGEINGNQTSGGIAGALSCGQLYGCKNSGFVSGIGVSGGVIGSLENGRIENCCGGTVPVSNAAAVRGAFAGSVSGVVAIAIANDDATNTYGAYSVGTASGRIIMESGVIHISNETASSVCIEFAPGTGWSIDNCDLKVYSEQFYHELLVIE